MLRTAHYAWQQEALSENARAVFDLGRELYDRLASLGKNVDGLGKALNNAVTSYNKTIGSLETRVLVTARKLNEMGVTDAELKAPTPVEEPVRALSAPDLITEAAPELVPGPGAVRADIPAPALVSGPRAVGAAG
jgi:DNA recombination protein RmuC